MSMKTKFFKIVILISNSGNNPYIIREGLLLSSGAVSSLVYIILWLGWPVYIRPTICLVVPFRLEYSHLYRNTMCIGALMPNLSALLHVVARYWGWPWLREDRVRRLGILALT